MDPLAAGGDFDVSTPSPFEEDSNLSPSVELFEFSVDISTFEVVGSCTGNDGEETAVESVVDGTFSSEPILLVVEEDVGGLVGQVLQGSTEDDVVGFEDVGFIVKSA